MRRMMLLAVLLLSLCGCGSMRNGWMRWRAAVTTLNCHIVLYTSTGAVIREWQTHAKVDSDGGEAWWVGDDGEQWHISGTFTVEAR